VQPLAIDLFCGLGGWTEGLLAEGYYVVGFDVDRHVYGEHKYPAQLVIQDVLTLHGRQFKDAALIVASPPCQEYSYMAMPWTRAKQRAAEYRSGVRDVRDLNRLFDAAVRIGREAGVPTVIENVRGAIPWVGRSRWNYGSYHLWGDVPALMPMTMKRGQKVEGFRFDGSFTSRDCGDDIKCGGDWFGPGEDAGAMRNQSSRSPKRKMASAMIAKIPLPLSRHIARVYHAASVSK
jgi:site-specific DNA-cytosine methylase